MTLLLLCLAMVPATAQDTKSYILIHKLDGSVDSLLLNNVRDVYHSRLDANGVQQPDVSTLRLRTVGGERVYPLTEIDHVVMPKFGRIISFMGTAQPESENAEARQFTSVDGTFPGAVGDLVVYKWTSGDKIYLSNNDRSNMISSGVGTTIGSFTFQSDSLVADQYVIYYPGGTNASVYNKVVVGKEQTQTVANNSDHIGVSGDCGTAVATRQANSNYNFALDHKTAIICFLPRVDTLKTLVLKKVRLKSPNGETIAGNFTLLPDSVTFDSEGSDSITLTTSDFTVPNNRERPVGADWEHTPQDSVAAYMVLAPLTADTRFDVRYTVYDTHSGQTQTVDKTATLKPEGGKVYPVTHKIDPRLFFAVLTDSAKWNYGQSATLYGSVNLPIPNVGLRWGFSKDHLDNDIPNLTCDDRLVFRTTPISNVMQRAYYYQAYANDGREPATEWFGSIEKFGMNREIINLGTSVRWSSINMGASTAEDIGDYYAWGELTTKDSYTQNNYRFYDNGYRTDIPANIAGNPEYDVVAKVWRGCWRMPTKAEIDELHNSNIVTNAKATQEDVSGYLFKNKNNDPDSVIFIPYAGYIDGSTLTNGNNWLCNWTATADFTPANTPSRAYYGQNTTSSSLEKYKGMPIRPVFESNIRTDKGEYLFIRADSISYSADHTSTNMYGTMRGLDDVVTDVIQGFVIGTDSLVLLDSDKAVVKDTLKQPASDNGSYHLPLTAEQMNRLGFGTTYWVRSFLTYDGHTWYGNSLKMQAMTIATDSTDWAVGRTTARLCGTVTGITESVAETVELGFVVGTVPNVTLETDGCEEIPCSSAANGKFVCILTGIADKQYYYRAFVRQGGRVAYGNPLMLGLEMVDLGLPSGLRWANINMGAKTPNDYGDYYQWGETTAQTGACSTANYQYYSNSAYLPDPGSDFAADPQFDAAQQNWKSIWRMPSKADAEELLANCDWEYTTLGILGNVKGYKLTSRKNGRSIFLPAAGFMSGNTTAYNPVNRLIYWLSTTDNTTSGKAYALDNRGTTTNPLTVFTSINNNHHYRHEGYPIRPVAMVSDTILTDQLIRLTTDSVTWEVGQTEATLHGYLIGLAHNAGATECGFIWATTENVTAETAGHQFLRYNTNRPTQSVASGPMRMTMTGVHDSTVYYYRTYVIVDDKYYYGNERQFGRRMVDLGLPSGTLWANINLGASSPDDSGDYYAWGETATKPSFTNGNYTYQGDYTNISGSSFDAAHVNWEGLWRMPTTADLGELIAECTWTEVTKYGQPMYKVVGVNGCDSIFIAKRSYMTDASVFHDGERVSMWTSELNTEETVNDANAYASDFIGIDRNIASRNRYLGLTVRPVVKTNQQHGETKFYLSTDSTDWYVGNKHPRLMGSVFVPTGTTVTARGFIVGYKSKIDVTSPDISDSEVTNVTAAIDAADVNIFRGSIDYPKDTTYYYRAYVTIGGTTYYGNVRRYGLSLVDMGSGIKWASLNLGAQVSSDYGERYAWGDTIPKSSYTLAGYRFYDNGKYENIGADISNKRPYDAAKWQWGGTWRMPTLAEVTTLINNSTWTWTAEDGVPGYRVTSTVVGYENNSIFLPAAGYQDRSFYQQNGSQCLYWTSTSYDVGTGESHYVLGQSGGHELSLFLRYYGLSVRPVTTVGNDEGGGNGVTGGHNKGHSAQRGGDGTGSGGAGTGDTGNPLSEQ